MPVTHLLDTQAWIWFFNQDPRAAKLVEILPPNCRLGVAAITSWEAAMLESKGRVAFHPDLGARVDEMLSRDLCALVPLRPEIAIAGTRLADFHGDPADRIIMATALYLGSILITSDRKILAWSVANGKPATSAL